MPKWIVESKKFRIITMSDRIYQEFYCNDCQGYFGVKLNMALNIDVVVVCPKCGREHPRTIENGNIYEKTYVPRRGAMHKEEIIPPLSAYHKKPWTDAMKKAEKGKGGANRREGVPIKDSETKVKDDGEQVQGWLRGLWTEFHGGN